MANDKGKDKGALARLELFEFLLSEASKAKLKNLTTPAQPAAKAKAGAKAAAKKTTPAATTK